MTRRDPLLEQEPGGFVQVEKLLFDLAAGRGGDEGAAGLLEAGLQGVDNGVIHD